MKQKNPGTSVANDNAKDMNPGEFAAGIGLKQSELAL